MSVPPGSAPSYDTGNTDPSAAAGGGVCSSCGRPLPPPDLEAVAAEIDHALSVESGRIVQRAQWAGGPPDGLVDTMFGWLPFARARRRLWERGQALWTERMTAALSGPCQACREAGAAYEQRPGDTVMQRAVDLSGYPTDPSGGEPATAAVEVGSMPGAPHGGGDLPTAAYLAPMGLPPDAQSSAMAPADASPTDAATAAISVPAELPEVTEGATAAIQAPSADEHESHTVILAPLPSLDNAPRLVVLEGPVHGRQFSLVRASTTIGRSISCHVTVEADAVSYDHARVVRDENVWRLETVAGSSASYVNDQPVSGSRQLVVGDVIRIGPARFRFEQTG